MNKQEWKRLWRHLKQFFCNHGEVERYIDSSDYKKIKQIYLVKYCPKCGRILRRQAYTLDEYFRRVERNMKRSDIQKWRF